MYNAMYPTSNLNVSNTSLTLVELGARLELVLAELEICREE